MVNGNWNLSTKQHKYFNIKEHNRSKFFNYIGINFPVMKDKCNYL